MSTADRAFCGSIPEIYDTYLVPLIFETYAMDLAGRVSSVAPQSVLETAAGSGVVSRALIPLLESKARYVISDLNQPMLDRAIACQPPDDRIVWQQVDALKLPFEDQSFDTVCCQFGVMFFSDRVAGYREALRVLSPEGRFFFSVWDRIAYNEFAQVVSEAVGRLFPGHPPQFLVRTPHGYHNLAVIEAELRTAGFSTIQIETIEGRSVAPNPRFPAIAYCQGTPLRNEIEERNAGALEEATIAATEEIARVFGKGEISAKIQAHIVVAGL